jgi:hypothetical protein
MAKKVAEEVKKKLRVWHNPQVGPKSKSFYVEVKTPLEARKILDVLADYDEFQLKNHIKPDYSNAQGLEEFDEDSGEWNEWCDKYGDDINAAEEVRG